MSRGWCQALSILMVWKKMKLHGTQTRRFYIKQHISGWKEVNCRVLKPDFFDVPMDFRFGKVWNCRGLKPAKVALQENLEGYNPNKAFAFEWKLHETQTSISLPVTIFGDDAVCWYSSWLGSEEDGIADAQTSRSVSHLEHLLRKNARLQGTQIYKIWQKHEILQQYDKSKTKLQGSQTKKEKAIKSLFVNSLEEEDANHFVGLGKMQDFNILKAWRKVKLQGTQTQRRHCNKSLRFRRRWNYMVLKRTEIYKKQRIWFGRR